MSELPPPQVPSVVLDANATVTVRRWPMVVAALAATAFVTYFVLALTLGSPEPYVMGPAATKLQEGYESMTAGRSLATDELRCIDEAATGIDPELLDGSAGDVLSGEADDPELLAMSGHVMDDCLQPESRQAITATQMTADGTVSAEDAECLAVLVDEAIMGAGGYTQMMEDPMAMGETFTVSILGSLEQCGLTMADLMGG